MKWKRPGGSILETLDDQGTMDYIAKHHPDWEQVKGSKKVTLYKRLEGEIVEGDENPFDEVIINSESFPESTVKGAIKDGWFKTEEEAAHAPPDPKSEVS